MIVTRESIDQQTARINAASESAQDVVRALVAQAVAEYTRPDGSIDVAAVRAAVIEAVDPVIATAAEASAFVAAEFYDGLRTEVVGEPLAEPVETGRAPEATEGAIRAFADDLREGDSRSFTDKVAGRVDYECKVAAARCTISRCKKDPKRPRFARVPSGAETCPFCIMLASRGYVYDETSKDFHAHAHCDCRIVPQFGGTRVAGYDPAALYDRYLEDARAKAERKAAREAKKRRGFGSVGEVQASLDAAETMEELERLVGDGMEAVAAMFPGKGRADKYLQAVSVSARRRMREIQGLPVGTVEYRKPKSSFVGTRDERDIAAHDALAVAGKNVVVVAEESPDGVSNIDVLVDGRPFEVKSPDGGSARAVESNLRKAKKQFDKQGMADKAAVVFNGIYFDVPDKEVASELERRSRMHGINAVVHIGSDGRVHETASE